MIAPVGYDRFTWTDWLPEVKARAAGGPGSGNFGHAGRPGEIGGSAPGEGTNTRGHAEDGPLDPQDIVGKLYDQAQRNEVVEIVTDPQSTWFLLPDGTRVGTEQSGLDVEHRDLIAEALDDGIHGTPPFEDVLETGIVRYSPGKFGGVEVKVPLTENQAQVIADDWNIAYKADFVRIDVSKGDRYESKTFETPVTADALRRWSRATYQRVKTDRQIHEAPDIEPKAAGGPGSGNFGHVGRPGEVGGSATTSTEIADLITKETGILSVFVSDNPAAVKAAQTTLSVLKEMKAKGYVMPHTLMITQSVRENPAGQTSVYVPEDAPIGKRGLQATLTLDVPSTLPSDMSLDTATAKAFGGKVTVREGTNHIETDRFAERTFRDVVVHEMGHVQHGLYSKLDFTDVSRDRNIYHNDEQPSLWIDHAAHQVSEYAAKNSQEFIAEAFTRLYRGDTLPPDAMTMYTFLNGPTDPGVKS